MAERFWHVGINVTDMDRSIAFYETIGFQLIQDGNVDNPAVGRAFMVEGGERLRFAHMRITDAPEEAMLDLIQWIDPPSEGQAAPDLHRPGLCRFSILSDRVDEQYAKLSEQGVEFVQPPETVMSPDGTRGWKILFARDPDGTLFHFVELVGEHGSH